MPEVDLRAMWSLARAEFGVWFAGATLMGMLVFMRYATSLRRPTLAAAAITATTVSWLVVSVVPVSLAGALIFEYAVFAGQPNAVSWSVAVLISALLATGSSGTILNLFRQRISRRALAALFFVNLACVWLAVYRMWAYVAANPPVAHIDVPGGR